MDQSCKLDCKGVRTSEYLRTCRQSTVGVVCDKACLILSSVGRSVGRSSALMFSSDIPCVLPDDGIEIDLGHASSGALSAPLSRPGIDDVPMRVM